MLKLKALPAVLGKVCSIFACVIAIEGCGGDDNILDADITPLGIGDAPDTPGTIDDQFVAPSTYLDCSNLDPDKVYVWGSLGYSDTDTSVLIDPDSMLFCLGLPERPMPSVISREGSLIYYDSDSRDIRTLSQDALSRAAVDGKWQWRYPEAPEANDPLLFTIPGTCLIGYVMINPSNQDLYYTCPRYDVYTENGIHYETLRDDMMSVLDDGTILVRNNDQLKLIAPNLAETILNTPDQGSEAVTRYETAKLYAHPDTLNPSVWVVAVNALVNDEARRYSIDLTTLEVTDEGEFAGMPVDMVSGEGSKLDGNGDLWQRAADIAGNDGFADSVIVKRPLLSSGVPSTVAIEAIEYETGSWVTRPDLSLHVVTPITGP